MKKNTLILSVGLLFSAISCKKPDATTSTISSFSTYSSMDTIYKMLEVKPKYVTVNGATGGSFYGNSGTRYVIPPNCLQDAAGNPVTTNVQFEVAEYLKEGDMIFSRVLPESYGEPLYSGGELSIKASLSGKPIFLKSYGCMFSATFPKDEDNVSGMDFFAGRNNLDTSDSRVNWEESRKKDSFAYQTIIYNGDTISVLSDSFIFCNADRFIRDLKDEQFTVTVNVAGGETIDNISQPKTFVIYDKYKGCRSLTHYKDGKCWGSHIPAIPIHIAFYCLINNRFYAGVTAATPKTGETYNVTLFETAPAQFKAQLNNLTK